MPETSEIVIIGSGSTAFAAALRAEALGAKVLLVEKSVLGGACINWGCVPSKTLIHSALFRHEALLGAGRGLGVNECGIDHAVLHARKEAVVKHLRQTRYLDVLKKSPGLRVLKGTARFTAPLTLEVEGEPITSGRFLIAVGGYPKVPAIPGLQETGYLTSMSALLAREFPASLIIIGGGVIAVEMGQMYRRFGVAVTILEHGPRILPQIEEEPALSMQQALVDEGLEIALNATICSVDRQDGLAVVQAEVNGTRTTYSAEKILLAVGTAPATQDIGLELAGVATDRKGFIVVDEQMRTTAPGVWAAGDVTGGTMIATVGAREGIVAIDNMLNPDCGCRMDHLSAPMAIFTDPEIGSVGHTAESARAAGFDVVVNTLPVAAIPKAQITGETSGCIKIVADRPTRRILGIHLACHRGAELINEAALAVRFRLTIEDLANTLHVYPSIGEGLRLCAQGFTRDVTRLSCCAE